MFTGLRPRMQRTYRTRIKESPGVSHHKSTLGTVWTAESRGEAPPGLKHTSKDSPVQPGQGSLSTGARGHWAPTLVWEQGKEFLGSAQLSGLGDQLCYLRQILKRTAFHKVCETHREGRDHV